MTEIGAAGAASHPMGRTADPRHLDGFAGDTPRDRWPEPHPRQVPFADQLVQVLDGDLYRVTLEESDGEPVVMVAGEIDPLAQHRLEEVIAAARPADRRLVIDLSGTTFIDSSGFVVLVRAGRTQLAAGFQMVLRAPSPAVMRLIDVFGLTDAFTVERSPDPAATDPTPGPPEDRA